MSAADELWAPAAPRRRIYLMRHGSVTYFDENGRPLGSEQVPLNARGEAQALAAGTLFRQHWLSQPRAAFHPQDPIPPLPEDF